MKKLLAGGMPRIWQLAHVFRDGERSATHHPEFAMLEWYRAGADYRDLMDECEALLRAGAGRRPAPRRCAGRAAAPMRGGRLAAPDASPRPFASYCRHRPPGDRPRPGARPMRHCSPRRRRGSASRRIPATIGKASFSASSSTASSRISASARRRSSTTTRSRWPRCRGRKPGDPRLAERFELYVCGLELANAFGELTDAAEQRGRFIADQARKQALYGETYPIDEDFLAALEHGLPDCAGIALGFDRLVMLCTGAEHIEEVLWAPVDLNVRERHAAMRRVQRPTPISTA